MALIDYRSAIRSTLSSSAARVVRTAASVSCGVGAAIAFSATGAEALESIVLKLPAIGDVSITLDDLKTFAETGEATGEFGELINDPSVAEQISKQDLQNILNAEFGIGAMAARAVPDVVDTCPGELVLGAVSQVLYAGMDQGDSSALAAALTSTASMAAKEQITTLDVFAQFEPDVMTVDVPTALAIFKELKMRVDPLIESVGDLTVREIINMDSATLEELLAAANVTDADVAKVEMAIRAFGSIEAGSDLDMLFSQIDLQSLLQKAMAGNFTGILGDLGAIDFSGIEYEEYEARISSLMVALMEVADLPVNTGSACAGVL